MQIQLRTPEKNLLVVNILRQEQLMLKGLLHTVSLCSYSDTMPDGGDDILEKYLVLENVLGEYKHQSFKHFMVAKSCYNYRCNELSDKIVDELYREVDFSLLKPIS